MATTLTPKLVSWARDLDEVMAAQAHLVEIRHSLRQVPNYKG